MEQPYAQSLLDRDQLDAVESVHRLRTPGRQH
jgi:hypothetical protein